MLQLFKGPITGPKFFAIFASFFIVIITVNVIMAMQAVGTFPGLVVRNSYVASQTFDAERAAQQALGWDTSAYVVDHELIVEIVNADGAVSDATVVGIFGRPTQMRDDQDVVLDFDGAVYRTPIHVSETGNWDFRMQATAADGTPFHQRLKVDFRN